MTREAKGMSATGRGDAGGNLLRPVGMAPEVQERVLAAVCASIRDANGTFPAAVHLRTCAVVVGGLSAEAEVSRDAGEQYVTVAIRPAGATAGTPVVARWASHIDDFEAAWSRYGAGGVEGATAIAARLPSSARSALLQHVFHALAPANDWRGPIDVTVDADMEELSCEAIVHMTATPVARHIVAGERGRVRLVAAGYRMGPAGDH